MNNEQTVSAAPQSEIVGHERPQNQKSKSALGWIIAWIVLIALFFVVGVNLYQAMLGPVSSGGAPNFSLTTFDGQTIELSSLRGQVVVVNFWASWCKPCEAEAADLEAFHRAYKDRGVVVLGVDYVDTESEARIYLQKFNITYANGPDLGTRISRLFRTKGVPETYIIDRDGQLIKAIIGPTTRANLTAIVEPLLK